MQVDNGTVAPNDALFDVVQASLDELARMRELVANGRRVSPARAMIARIHALSRPKAAQPAAAAKPASAQPTAPQAQPAAPRAAPATGASPLFSEHADSAQHAESAPDHETDTAKFGAEVARLTSQESEESFPILDDSAPTSKSLTPDFDQPDEAGLPDQAAEEVPLSADQPTADDAAAGGAEPSPEEFSPSYFVSEAVNDAGPGQETDQPSDDLPKYDWQSGGAGVDDAQAVPEQAWLKDTSQAPWPPELAVGDESNALTAEAPGIQVEEGSPGDAGVEHHDLGADAQGGQLFGRLDFDLSGDVSPEGRAEAPASAESSAQPEADSGNGADVDPAMIVVEEPSAFDALPAVDAPAPVIERLSATGIHAAPIEQFINSAAQHAAARSAAEPAPASAPPQTPAVSKSVSISFERRSEPRGNDEGLLPPQPVPPGREPVAPVERQEMARVDAELLDTLLNISGEASIARSRLEQQLGSFDFNLGELSRTVTRLKEQLRSLEIETEAQILHRHEDEGGHRSEFDPLELDRYSSIQQFSRALAETANDVASIQQLLENQAKDTQTLLQQQARTITELQNGLMRTRMVPFQRHVQRLARIVRQAASDTGKRAELIVEGASGELDRQVLERMLPPFEHMLRNAVVHGIEKPEERVRAGKPEVGRIVLELHREGAEVMVRLVDDGGGMNLKAIRAKGHSLGLIAPGQVISDEDAMQLILEPGFSTAGAITQQAGRGVGMDVVATEIKRLGGALHMETKVGEGTVFTIRLPFTLAISHALVVRTGEEFYALPLPTVEGVLRLSKAEVMAHLGKDASAFDYGGQKYRFQHLATFVSLEPSPLPEQDVTIPVVLVRAGEHSTGLVADELVGSREIVVKSVGPQISSIRGISGATILGDGRIVIILDIGALVRAEWRSRPQTPIVPKEKADKRVFAMVVDDSITVRRVTQRLLERNGMRVLTARDGMDAVALLQDNIPDIILLDIEMPRMDGYEVAAHVRNDPRLKDVPIIMITSRVGEKHRARAIELGVDDYLGKPYQEAQLLEAIGPLVERRRVAIGSHLYAAELG
jgi:chemotaxis protein histidine kinase CheA/CheY-like chemotaxis protein